LMVFTIFTFGHSKYLYAEPSNTDSVKVEIPVKNVSLF
jgi:hypothetical protein